MKRALLIGGIRVVDGVGRMDSVSAAEMDGAMDGWTVVDLLTVVEVSDGSSRVKV